MTAATITPLHYDDTVLERIDKAAAEARPGRALRSLLAHLFIIIGFVTAKSFTVAFRSGVWIGGAFREGWEQANGPTKRQQIDALIEQNKQLQIALSRFEG